MTEKQSNLLVAVSLQQSKIDADKDLLSLSLRVRQWDFFPHFGSGSSIATRTRLPFLQPCFFLRRLSLISVRALWWPTTCSGLPGSIISRLLTSRSFAQLSGLWGSPRRISGRSCGICRSWTLPFSLTARVLITRGVITALTTQNLWSLLKSSSDALLRR